MMKKVLISIPDNLAARMRATIPARSRSKTISQLIEQEVGKREQQLYKAACAVEKDDKLNKDMQDWDITSQDGLEDESW